MPAVGFDLIAQRGVVRGDVPGLARDVVGGIGHGVELLEQRVVRDNDIVDHGAVENVQIGPCDGLERGGAPGGIVAEQGLKIAEGLTAEDRFGADLGEGGEIAVFIVGIALLRQQDGRSHQNEQRAGKEQGHRPFTDAFHAAYLRVSESEIDEGVERARDELAVGKHKQRK